MAKKTDLWMPLYFGAYLTDTMHLTAEQHGAYLLLLMATWKRGGALPDDDKQLAGIARLTPARWKQHRPVIAAFFNIGAGVWRQKRLTRELDIAQGRSKVAAENGGKGGRPPKAKRNPDKTENESKTKPREKAKHNPQESSGPLPRPLPTSPLPTPGPSPSPEGQPPSDSPQKSPRSAAAKGQTRETWHAYGEAYRLRYGVDPTGNAKVNGMLARFIERVPLEEAPEIAAFYVTSNRGFYVQGKHPIDLLLRDAEAIRTEWQTGRAATDTAARQTDRTAAQGEVWGDLIDESARQELLRRGEELGLEPGEREDWPDFRARIDDALAGRKNAA